jgi:hypothetical protein
MRSVGCIGSTGSSPSGFSSATIQAEFLTQLAEAIDRGSGH